MHPDKPIACNRMKIKSSITLLAPAPIRIQAEPIEQPGPSHLPRALADSNGIEIVQGEAFGFRLCLLWCALQGEGHCLGLAFRLALSLPVPFELCGRRLAWR